MRNTGKRPRKRFAWLMGAVPLVLVGGLGWLTYRDLRQQRLNESLLGAIFAKNPVALERSIAAGGDPNTSWREADNRNALVRTFDKLIHPSMTEGFAERALFMAVKRKNIALVRILLGHGADPNSRSSPNELPLVIAMRRNHHSLLANLDRHKGKAPGVEPLSRLLLEHGANPNLCGEDGILPLTVAKNEDMPKEVIALLRKYGAHE